MSLSGNYEYRFGLLWVTPEKFNKMLQEQWDRGLIIKQILSSSPPYIFRLKGPAKKDLSENLQSADYFATLWEEENPYYKVVTRKIGTNDGLFSLQIPSQVRFESAEDLCGYLGRMSQLIQLESLRAECQFVFGDVRPYFMKHAVRLMENPGVFPKIVRLASELAGKAKHAGPGAPKIPFRQLRIPGVDRKFIYGCGHLVTDFLDLVLPPAAVNRSFKPISEFPQRYGFAAPQTLLRCRSCDPRRLLGGFVPPMSETALDVNSLAALNPADEDADTVIICCNEHDYLALTGLDRVWAVYYSGWDIRLLLSVSWLTDKNLLFLGDIGRSSCRVLSEFREVFRPKPVKSVLLRKSIVLAHTDLIEADDPLLSDRGLKLDAEEKAALDTLLEQIPYPGACIKSERLLYPDLIKAVKDLLPKPESE